MPTKEREPFASLVLYHLFKWSFVSPVLHTYFRGRIYGAEKVPQSGALIAVCNHASDFDPPILSNCLRRPVSYMAKEELFKVPLFKQGIKLYGAYPVKRGASDRSAIRAAMKALENGWIAGIFLDGTRSKNGKVNNPKLGAALIAAKTQVPLIPVSLWGTEKILSKGSFIPKPVPITIRIGDVIEPPRSTKKEELQVVTNKCAEIINQMHSLGR
ncbi:MAG: lysophospholipid acyltransferase family protein [Xenococcaceae cyanobacterium MO_188.B29]|nr:lysophospholipid acyltransferase family protein [Xenococcaceae cyanobacterium MO_188.B29]